MKTLYTGVSRPHEPEMLRGIRGLLEDRRKFEGNTTGDNVVSRADYRLSWLLKQYDDLSEDNANLAKQLDDARSVIHEYEAAQPPIDEDRLRSLNIAR